MKPLPLCFALLLLLPGAALAAGEPEEVYARLHAAALEGELQEILRHATARRRAEVAALAGSPHAAQHLVGLMPRSYEITAKAVSPDRSRAQLAASGVAEFMERDVPVYGIISLAREGGEWRVDAWEWSNLKPAATAPEKAAAKPGPGPKPAPVARAPAPVPTPAPAARAPCEIKPVMSDEDLRRCGAAPPPPYSTFFLP